MLSPVFFLGGGIRTKAYYLTYMYIHVPRKFMLYIYDAHAAAHVMHITIVTTLMLMISALTLVN
jgi:hypothetical protein